MMIGPHQGYLDGKICGDIWLYKNHRAEILPRPKMAAGSIFPKIPNNSKISDIFLPYMFLKLLDYF